MPPEYFTTMKKTLFTILACCLSLGSAQAVMADRDYDITLTFSDLTPGVAEGAGSMAELLVGANRQSGTLSPVGQKSVAAPNNVYTDAFLSPDTNVGNTSGATWTYTYSFVAGADFTLNSLSLAMLTFSGDCQTQFSDRTSGLEISLTQTPVNSTTGLPIATYDNSVTYRGAGVTSTTVTPTYDFTDGTITNGSGAIVTVGIDSPVFINVGDTVTLTVTAKNGSNVSNGNGHFVGLGAARFNVTVPEPATATLSLLAFAGLAARRRRK